MYHAVFNGSPYETGYRCGASLLEHGSRLLENVPCPVTKERIEFSEKCLPAYRKFFPEVLDEIRGLADGQGDDEQILRAVLFSMYAMPPEPRCSCFAVSGDGLLLGRNSDFLSALEDFNTNVIYRFPSGSYSFTGNTTAFIEMEDGVNEQGLAVGLTAVYPARVRAGLNAGMLLRLFLEKCRTVKEVIGLLEQVPVSSAQTFTMADRTGDIALVECCSEQMAAQIKAPGAGGPFVCAVNAFHLKDMVKYNVAGIDNWESERRYETLLRSLTGQAGSMNPCKAMGLLGGKEGFLCQYDRSTGKDTVWSVVYDLKNLKIYRVEGNPGRENFCEDNRFFA